MSFGNCLTEKGEDVELTVFIQPRAQKTQIVGLHGDAVKIRITAPPVEGKANAELCRFLAKGLGVPLGRVEIVAGTSSRRKRILIKQKTLVEMASFLSARVGHHV